MDVTIDTSAVLAVLLNEASRSAILSATEGVELMSAPTLPWELGNALSALFRRGRLTLGEADGVLESFEQIPIRIGEVDLAGAVEIAHEHQIYAYDAYILECASRYRTPLLSLDRGQVAVARRLQIEVLEVET